MADVAVIARRGCGPPALVLRAALRAAPHCGEPATATADGMSRSSVQLPVPASCADQASLVATFLQIDCFKYSIRSITMQHLLFVAFGLGLGRRK